MEKVSARDLKQQLQQHHLKQATRELKSHEEMKSLFEARGFCKRQTDGERRQPEMRLCLQTDKHIVLKLPFGKTLQS